jgi:hypothetical protein
LINFGNKSEKEKQVNMITKRSIPIINGDFCFCMRNHSITPATAMMNVGDSEPELKSTINKSVEAKIIN